MYGNPSFVKEVGQGKRRMRRAFSSNHMQEYECGFLGDRQTTTNLTTRIASDSSIPTLKASERRNLWDVLNISFPHEKEQGSCKNRKNLRTLQTLKFIEVDWKRSTPSIYCRRSWNWKRGLKYDQQFRLRIPNECNCLCHFVVSFLSLCPLSTLLVCKSKRLMSLRTKRKQVFLSQFHRDIICNASLLSVL